MKKRAAEHTSYDVRKRWDDKNLKKYGVSLHRTNHAEEIAYIEAHKHIGTSELFRRGIEKLMSEEP